MIKTWWGVLLFFVLVTSVAFAQTFHSKPQRSVTSGTKTSSTGETRYFLRLFNCDDGCTARVGDGVVSSTGFGKDSGWIDFTDALQDGPNQIKFSAENEGGGIAYGFQIRKNQMVLFEKVCGRAGTIGCESNRNFPKGVAREFSYEVRLSLAERPLAYTRWLRFLAAFRAAVNKRDRVALRGMIASPFHSQDPGEISSPDGVIRWLDRSKFWQELQREAAPGARFTFWFDMGRGRPTRCSKDGIFCFELGSDGRWRLAEQGENETGN